MTALFEKTKQNKTLSSHRSTVVGMGGGVPKDCTVPITYFSDQAW